ncbi:Uncharacterised protein [Vibrio cholerae]|nr:Uncharacterised protein [Vibrio cholerae]
MSFQVSLDTGLVSFNDQFRQDMLGISIANCLQHGLQNLRARLG